MGENCMGDDGLAGPCTGNVGVANSVGALWQLGGGALALFFVFCTVQRFASFLCFCWLYGESK